MSCVDANLMASLMADFIGEFASLIDIYPQKTTSYNATTGVPTIPSTPHLNVEALKLSASETMGGSDLLIDKHQAIFLIAAKDLAFVPSVNDAVEFPASSVRGAGDYIRFTVRRVDQMVQGDTVIQYALQSVSL